MTKKDLIVVRDQKSEDFNFMIATFLQGLYQENPFFHLIDEQIYFTHYHPIIEKLIQTSEAKVACLKEDEDVILGYALLNATTLHWMFVKKVWRNIGIAKDLLPPHLKHFSHFSTEGQRWIEKHAPHLTFNPFAI